MRNCFIPFRSKIDGVHIPNQLNNPFRTEVPEIALVAARELQAYISTNEGGWAHNFGFDDSSAQGVKGKMFGVLVVRNLNGELGYLATFSGTLDADDTDGAFVPSVFNPAVDNYFINRGMKALSVLTLEINELKTEVGEMNVFQVNQLRRKRKEKSYQLQQQLFESYQFTNLQGKTENLVTIFEKTPNKRPAAGTGECAAPKLLQYAIGHQLQPIAIAEFWWGRSPKKRERLHKLFYPACQDKCRHLLEFMLNDDALFTRKS